MSKHSHSYLVVQTSCTNCNINTPHTHIDMETLLTWCFLFTDMVDSPMYAVINNSMGSGNVSYECKGHERRLVHCTISTDSSATPCYYALVMCAYKTHIFVAQKSYDSKYDYLTVQEGDGNIQVCLQTNRVVTEPVHVHVETTHTNTTGNISLMLAIGKCVT